MLRVLEGTTAPNDEGKEMNTEKFIARRVGIGHNENESRALLFTLMATFKGDNLVHALVYNQFATVAQAAKAVAMDECSGMAVIKTHDHNWVEMRVKLGAGYVARFCTDCDAVVPREVA